MTVTYDLSTSVGKVRLLIGDTNMTNIFPENAADRSVIFLDEEISAFLSMSDGNVFMAGAMAFRAVAASRALIDKYVSITLSQETYSMAGMLDHLRALAKDLEDKAKDVLDANYGIVTGRIAVSEFEYPIAKE